MIVLNRVGLRLGLGLGLKARVRARTRARARASPYYLLHSQSAQQFINCCADYAFTNCAARYI